MRPDYPDFLSTAGYNNVATESTSQTLTSVLIPRTRWKAFEAYRNTVRSSVVWAEMRSYACSTSMRYAPSSVTCGQARR